HRHWWRWVTSHIMTWTDTPRRRWTWIGSLTVVPLALAGALLPPADYLPEGEKNFVMGFMVTPPGMGTQTARDELVEVIDERLLPYLRGDKQPQIKSYFLGSAKSWGTCGQRRRSRRTDPGFQYRDHDGFSGHLRLREP
ncbi:MAG: hypothetical protein MUE63_14180, partial [Xanthomonadales bacterium]|nr:hypothetical protein [Xanthomonadales bacterium]